MITIMIMSITEKVKKIIRAKQMGINQVLSLVYRSKAKEGRTPLLNANNPPRKILPWGLMVLRESVLNGYCPKGKVIVCVLEKGKI